MLASKAALKRERKVLSSDTPAAAPAVSASALASEAAGPTLRGLSGNEGLADYALCVKYGYNLRGLRADGHCPECGTPVAQSAHGDRLAGADPAWLARICRGQVYIAVGSVLAPMLPPVTGMLLRSAGAATPGFRHVLTWTLCGAALVVVLIGVVRLTTLDPRLSLTRQPLGLRKLSRGAALVTLLCIAGEVGLVLLPSAAPRPVQAALDWAAPAFLACTIVVVTLYLARLAERVPDQQLARRTSRAAWGFMVCLPGPVVLGLGYWARSVLTGPRAIPDFAKWVALLLGGALSLLLLLYLGDITKLWRAYRKIFQRCLVESRQLAA